MMCERTMMGGICMKSKPINLIFILLNLTVLALLTLSSGRPTAADYGDFESCDVQMGRDSDDNPYQNQIPEPECEALVSLYNHTNGPNWDYNGGWLETGPCGWHGVGCEWIDNDPPQYRVTSVFFADPQLSGSIPSEIGDLPLLESLSMAVGQLSGSIPSSIGNLTSLEELYLDHNQLSGGIPSSIGYLTNLKVLWLQTNQLSGSIPPQIGNLTNLESLRLHHNQLSGSIPPQIGNLTKLKGLWLDNNQLSGPIPLQIGNLTNLVSLTVAANPLFGELPASMTDLLKLDFFSITYTCLIEPQDDAFQEWLDNLPSGFWPNIVPHPDCPCLEETHEPIQGRIIGASSCTPTGPFGKLWAKWVKSENESDLSDLAPDEYWDGKTLEFDSGEKLELQCVATPFYHFALYYTPPNSIDKVLVGGCPFEGGCNQGWFIHAGDRYKNNKPDCLFKTAWISKDHNENDNPNPFTNQPETGTSPETGEPPLDWAVFTYDAKTQERNWNDYQFAYLYGPPVEKCTLAEHYGVGKTSMPPDSWPGTATFLGSSIPLLFGPEMVLSDHRLCDFNGDGNCDIFDFQIFQGVLGACEDDTNYHPTADVDGDRCVTLTDQEYLFPVPPNADLHLIFLPTIFKDTP